MATAIDLLHWSILHTCDTCEVSLLHMHHQPVRVHVWMSQHHSISLFVLFGDAAIIVSIKVPQNFIDTPEAARFEKTSNEKGLAKIGCASWPLCLWWEIKIEINIVRDNALSVAVHCLSNSPVQILNVRHFLAPGIEFCYGAWRHAKTLLPGCSVSPVARSCMLIWMRTPRALSIKSLVKE